MVQLADFESLHGELCARFPGDPVGVRDQRSPDLHVYHAPNSICSQKVRTVLAFIGLPYVSHQLNIFQGDSYHPDYVRLRARTCQSAALSLARIHRGSTAVSSFGCDACVVPTLVDSHCGEVFIDSYRICLELESRSPEAGLMPDTLRKEIEAEIHIVDELPNYPLLAAFIARRATGEVNTQFSLSKVARCEALIKQHSNDELLKEAYDAKRAKEQSAADDLFTEDMLLQAETDMASAFSALESRLPGPSLQQQSGTSSDHGGFLFGTAITMADLFWALELIRAEDLGLAPLWQNASLPRLDAYYRRLCALPAIQRAVLDWPGARLG